MGVMRFLIQPPGRIEEWAAQRAYLAGLDRIPWPCRARVTPEYLLVERAVSDSGNLFIPWNAGPQGEMLLSTGTLAERAAPYQLAVELARGQVNQVRCHLAEWQSLGLAVGAEITQALAGAVAHFSRAATGQHEPLSAAAHADLAIQAALAVGRSLAGCYAEQALAVRRHQGQAEKLLLGCQAGLPAPHNHAAGRFTSAFNAAAVPLNWRELEGTEGVHDWSRADRRIAWCREHNLRVLAGPLLLLDEAALPDWLCLWEGDIDNLLDCIGRHVESAVQRYRRKVDAWLCASRVNVGQALSLGEEERLRVAVRVIESTRRNDPDTPIILSFDRPWGEYLSRQQLAFSPFDFADALVRAGLGLSGLALEINLGLRASASFPRDLLAYSRLLDQWSLLELPLYVVLTVPSRETGGPKPAREAWSLARQQAWVDGLLPLLLAKPAVAGVIWGQWNDAPSAEEADCGLVTSDGQAKPALACFERMKSSLAANAEIMA